MMFGRMQFKRAIKHSVSTSAVLAHLVMGRPASRSLCILMYHRIADLRFRDPEFDDWNVPPHVFEKQIAALCEFAEVVPLSSAPGLLQAPISSSKPLACVTFDDGYANFYTQALPILKRYNVPATVFVVTNLVGRAGPLPFDRWSMKNHFRVSQETCQAMGWDQLENCIASGLVTVGSHSHNHRPGQSCTPQQLRDEVEQSRFVLSRHLGPEHCWAYAYPYGSTRLGIVTDDYVNAVKTAGYDLAVTTDLGVARTGSNLLLLPRVEVNSADGHAAVRAKACGALGPYYLADKLRSPRHDVLQTQCSYS